MCNFVGMNRKTIILCIAVLAALVFVVAGAVTALYTGESGNGGLSPDEARSEAASSYPLLNAVPADAAMILRAGTLRGGVSELMDSTRLFGLFFTGTGKSDMSGFLRRVSSLLKHGELGAIKNSDMLLSVHYSGDLAPLLIIDPGRVPSDSTGAVWRLVREADSCSVSHSFLSDTEKDSPLGRRTLLALSTSESLVKSAERHVRSRVSVLEDSGFAEAALSMKGSLSVLVNHSYSGKLALSFLSRNLSVKSGFVKSFAEWTSYSCAGDGEKRIVLEGAASASGSPKYFTEMLRNMSAGPMTAADILPAGTRYAFVMSVADVVENTRQYGKFLDASGKLDKMNSRAAVLAGENGISPEAWARQLNVKEVCLASVPAGDGYSDVLLVRHAAAASDRTMRLCREYVPAVFGELFTVSDTSYVETDGWIVTGDAAAVKSFMPAKGRKTLSSFLSGNGVGNILPGDGALFCSYCSLSSDPDMLKNIFRPEHVQSARHVLDGMSYSPAVFTISPGNVSMKLDVARIQYSESAAEDAQALARDTVVTVPSGPFEVKNCGTGKMNLFSQQSNNYLVLKEMDGKGIWGVPFHAPICGAVAEIDYFANGKIQFLFGSGSSIYLIDRLGRFVKPFPVDLGKEILIGPAAYDFTGAHGYTAIVLHKDNSIGMYDLHGKVPASWKGIKPRETVKALPELIEVKGKRYWAVRTSSRILFYGFNGGEPLYDPQGNKMVRPDSKITVTDGGNVSAVCYDGKERTVKL